ncbi:MAG: alpha-amylase family glycosyl hydrolase [Flavobacteriales bacterium]
MNRLLFSILLLTSWMQVPAQILTSSPPFPTQTDEITIFYDADLGNGALVGVFPLYAHTGVISNLSSGPNDWQHVQGNWGTADPEVVMDIISIPQNRHSITFTPQTFYGLQAGETVTRLMFVFRNGNGSVVGRNADGSDIHLDIYPAGFNAAFLAPGGSTTPVLDVNEQLTVTAGSSQASTITIYVNGDEVSTASGVTALDYSFSSAVPGEYEVSMIADNGQEQITDTFTLVVLPSVNVQASPAGTIDGINITGASSVRLQLYAPNKDYVFVIGDFNEWQFDLDYFMNRTPDGGTYWLDITGLDPNTEYRFQYYVSRNDQGMRVADVYSEKILDFWHDPWIPETTYPNLTPYPEGLTSEPVSTFKINEPAFNWTDQSFVRPPKERLLVYELHVRDFVADRTFQSVLDTLDYLENLGVTAVQFMPLNEFEGNDSWGYNPSFYFALDKAYGTEEKFKELVNECHNRGMAVILDIALNHSFGQNPMVRMYFDPDAGEFGQPTAESPWFNQVPRHDFNVGYDFNHESQRTRNFSKRVLAHWMEEYHIDGYRFDLSKGFTQNNTLGNIAAWNAYDQSRVNILTDYYNHIQANEPGAYVILEHLGDNPEESALSALGMMLWGKMTHEYEEAAMGYSSNLSWASYQARGWAAPNLISYAESHDEERVMYKSINFGNSSGSYDVQELNTALKRQELVHCLLIPIPGPHMIWQFGELGYDYSINTCTDGVTITPDCRTAAKPIRWDYYANPNRLYTYKVVSALNQLQRTEPIFSTTNFNIDLAGMGKRIHLNGTSQNAVVVGNTNVVGLNMVPGFQHTGTWYDYFTGTSFEVTDLGASFFYEPGEYHLYTDYALPLPDLNVSVEEVTEFFNIDFVVYPNPASDVLHVGFRNDTPGRVEAQLVDMTGRTAARYSPGATGNGIQGFQWEIGRESLPAGTYILRVITPGAAYTRTIVLNP